MRRYDIVIVDRERKKKRDRERETILFVCSRANNVSTAKFNGEFVSHLHLSARVRRTNTGTTYYYAYE